MVVFITGAKSGARRGQTQVGPSFFWGPSIPENGLIAVSYGITQFVPV
jgi:hypothetical protein